MRQNGFVNKLYQAVVSTTCKIYPKGYLKYIPQIQCSCCGKWFSYRGIRDSDSVDSMDYNPTTGGGGGTHKCVTAYNPSAGATGIVILNIPK